MTYNMESRSLCWGESVEFEDEMSASAVTLPRASNTNSCQTPVESGEGAHQDTNPAPMQEVGIPTTDQRERRARQNNNQALYPKTVGGHQPPYQRADRGHQTTYQQGRGGYQSQRGRQNPNHQASDQPGHQRIPPLMEVKLDTGRIGARLEGQGKMEVSERSLYESRIMQLKEELKHLNPSYSIPQDMFYYSLKSKDELMGIISAQIKLLAELVGKIKKQETENTTALQMEALREQLREKEEANQAMRKEIASLEAYTESLSDQVQNERDINEIQQKEHEEFRLVQQELASQNFQQIEKLELHKLHLELQVKTLQEEVLSREAEGSKRSNQMQEEHQNLVSLLKTQLQEEKVRADTLHQEREELSLRLQETASQVLHLSEKIEADKVSWEQREKDLQEELQMQQTEDCRKDNENRAAVQNLEVKLQEKDSSCHELASKLKYQEEVSQALQEEVKELQKVLNDIKSQEKAEPSLSLQDFQNDSEEGNQSIVQETSEAIQTTPGMVEESPAIDDVTPEVVETTPEIVTPETDGIVEASPALEEVGPAVDHETPEVERVSLWRRFKKSVTPRSRRQYKHLRLQRQDTE